MNGIICINKPQGFTSFDVVAKMRGISGVRKIGHGGTLDPMATGVLPLFFGTATGAVDRMEQADKRYIATFILGMTSDTLDITGSVTETGEVTASYGDVLAAAEPFRGKIMQQPPMYSAIRVGGKRLYDLARAGKEVERPSRPVEIYRLDIQPTDEKNTYTMDVHCSKGTYVRSLIDDLGRALGCGAVMSRLQRTQSGPFTLSDCITLDQAQQEKEHLEQFLVPTQRMFETLPRIELNSYLTGLFTNGVRLRPDQVPAAEEEEMCAVYDRTGTFLGLATLHGDAFIVDKMFYRR